MGWGGVLDVVEIYSFERTLNDCAVHSIFFCKSSINFFITFTFFAGISFSLIVVSKGPNNFISPNFKPQQPQKSNGPHCRIPKRGNHSLNP